MSSIKNVAVVGAAGQLGAPILAALISSGLFNLTIVTRPESKSTFPPSVKVLRTDLSSLAALTTAFANQDAVVSTVGTDGLQGQTILFDAAVAAGVKHFLPSEFGSDISMPGVAALPVFGYKVAVRTHIEAAVANGANIAYTYVINGGFLDWGLQMNFLLSWQDGKPALFDGGDNVFSVTTLASVGKAVVGVLTHPAESKNRSVYVEDLQVSQKQLLALAQKAGPEKTFEPVVVSLAETEKNSFEGLAKGDYSMGTMVGFIFISLFGGSKYGQPFPKNDNALLGVEGKTEDDVVAIFKGLFKA